VSRTVLQNRKVRAELLGRRAYLTRKGNPIEIGKYSQYFRGHWENLYQQQRRRRLGGVISQLIIPEGKGRVDTWTLLPLMTSGRWGN